MLVTVAIISIVPTLVTFVPTLVTIVPTLVTIVHQTTTDKTIISHNRAADVVPKVTMEVSVGEPEASPATTVEKLDIFILCAGIKKPTTTKENHHHNKNGQNRQHPHHSHSITGGQTGSMHTHTTI
jgi:hypothetical protein